MRTASRPLTAFGTKLALLWAGLDLGVAFLATPAKFLAPTLTLPVALDVGRHTFLVCNRVELLVCLLLLCLAPWGRIRWLVAFTPPAALVLLQTFWLIPALDQRVGMILDGLTLAPSPLHLVYILVETSKTLWLAILGFVAWPWRLPLGARLPPAFTGKIVTLHGAGARRVL